MSKISLSISYEQSPHFKAYPVSGVFGGPNASGDIVCHIYTEYTKPPKDTTIEIDTESKTLIENKSNNTETTIRELQAAFFLRPDIAKSIGEWLINNANKVSDATPITYSKPE